MLWAQVHTRIPRKLGLQLLGAHFPSTDRQLNGRERHKTLTPTPTVSMMFPPQLVVYRDPKQRKGQSVPGNIATTLRRMGFLPSNAPLNSSESEVNSASPMCVAKREMELSCNSKVSTANPSQRKVLKI